MVDIGLIKRIIEDNLTEIHSTKDLEIFTNYSVETIRKEFFLTEHVTLVAFIRNKRVKEAKRLLTTTDLTCQMICYQVGFLREEVGARVFKRLTGMTMMDYRRHSRVKVTAESLKVGAAAGIARVIRLNPTIWMN